MAISPPNNDFLKFYTSKLYGLTGMMVCGRSKLDDIGLNVLGCQADILGTMSHACDAVERVLIWIPNEWIVGYNLNREDMTYGLLYFFWWWVGEEKGGGGGGTDVNGLNWYEDKTWVLLVADWQWFWLCPPKCYMSTCCLMEMLACFVWSNAIKCRVRVLECDCSIRSLTRMVRRPWA